MNNIKYTEYTRAVNWRENAKKKQKKKDRKIHMNLIWLLMLPSVYYIDQRCDRRRWSSSSLSYLIVWCQRIGRFSINYNIIFVCRVDMLRLRARARCTIKIRRKRQNENDSHFFWGRNDEERRKKNATGDRQAHPKWLISLLILRDFFVVVVVVWCTVLFAASRPRGYRDPSPTTGCIIITYYS